MGGGQDEWMNKHGLATQGTFIQPQKGVESGRRLQWGVSPERGKHVRTTLGTNI